MAFDEKIKPLVSVYEGDKITSYEQHLSGITKRLEMLFIRAQNDYGHETLCSAITERLEDSIVECHSMSPFAIVDAAIMSSSPGVNLKTLLYDAWITSKQTVPVIKMDTDITLFEYIDSLNFIFDPQ